MFLLDWCHLSPLIVVRSYFGWAPFNWLAVPIVSFFWDGASNVLFPWTGVVSESACSIISFCITGSHIILLLSFVFLISVVVVEEVEDFECI